MLGLKPIQLLPARERVAAALRKAIISKQISEGEVLTLENTAQELGVSITPVREAFQILPLFLFFLFSSQILARDGLIELKQSKGAVVLGINETTIREHYQVRAALESAACALCCENDADLEGIRNALKVAEESLKEGDSSNFADYNQSFHYEIWKASGNKKIQKMLAELWNGLSIGAKSTVEEYAHRSHKEHKDIFAALEKRDAGQVRELMDYHIRRSMEDVLTRYQ